MIKRFFCCKDTYFCAKRQRIIVSCLNLRFHTFWIDIQKRDVETIAELKLALTTHGFFTITDHGIADEVLQSSYRLSKDFFSLPENIKNTYAHPEKAGARGYTPFGKETAVGETTPDLKEFWHHGPMIDNSYDSRISGNISVTEISDFNSQFDLRRLSI